MSTYLIVGGLYVDHIHTVESYPEEDTAIRALATRRSRGGNAATSAVVLSQLLGGARGDVVRLMCAAPVSDPDTAFALASLAHEAGVDASLREEFDGVGQPAAFITVSRSTGSRTIISSRNGLPELTSAHFVRAMPALLADREKPLTWVHFEAREPESVAAMASALRTRAAAASRTVKVSVEVEKPYLTEQALLPLLKRADVVFLSREWCERQLAGKAVAAEEAQATAHRCLKAIAKRCSGPSTFVAAWGSEGAFALDAKTHAAIAVPVSEEDAPVIDTLGAGDTFNGACIYAFALGATAEAALRTGAAVAGRKVRQEGFDNLAAALPAGGRGAEGLLHRGRAR